MNLFHFAGIVGAVLGFAGGAMVGKGAAGIAGGVAGAIAGIGVGGLAAAGLVAAAFAIAIRWERLLERRRLAPHFGRYWRADRAAAWDAAKEQLGGGEAVRGPVLAEMYHGRVLDIGCGFPALLDTVDDDGAVASELPAVAVAARALVLRFDDFHRAIILTTSAKRWLVFEGATVGYLAGTGSAADEQVERLVPLTNRAQRTLGARLRRGDEVPCQVASAVGMTAVSIHLAARGRVRVRRALADDAEQVHKRYSVT